MNAAAKAGSSEPARPGLLTASVLEQERRLANAEQVARFLYDDVTHANAKIEVLSEQLDEMGSQNREMHRALHTLAERLGVAQDLVREGRASLAIAMMHDLIALAKRGRVQL